MRTLTALAGALSLVASSLIPSAATAQVRLIPQAGLYAPATEVPSAGEAVEIGKRDASFAFGLGLEFGAFRITALHGTDSEVPVGNVGCDECVRSTVSVATAAFVLRPFPELVVARPYFLLGGGARRVDFDREDLEEEQFDALFSDETDPALHVGLGVELDLRVLRLTGELSDFVSSLENPEGESDIQHDFFLTLGLVIG